MKVIKRNGRKVNFDRKKIISAIQRANEDLQTENKITDEEIKDIAADIEEQYNEEGVVKSVEDIQDSIEKALMNNGYDSIAKSYILYRKQREKLREINKTTLDYKKTVDDYLKVDDWRVKENSTVTYSIGGLILSNSGAITANYWLSEVYDDEIGNAHKNADIHIHDLSMLSGYCAGWSLKQLIQEGLGGVPGKITSSPATHLSTLCNQMVNFLGIMQNEWAGAQAFSSFDTYLAPFVKADNLTYKEVKQCIQSFVYGVNTPSRWGCVPIDTEVLSTNGWKKYDELTEDDYIYTWNMENNKLEINKVNKVISKPFKGSLHSYTNSRGYEQTVTPNHRMLVYKHNSRESIIKKSEEIFDVQTPYNLPTKFAGSMIPDADISDDMIMLAAMIYADGNFDFRPNGSIHKVKWYKSPRRWGQKEFEDICDRNNLIYTKKIKNGFGPIAEYTFYGDSARDIVDLCTHKHQISKIFFELSERQARLFLETWMKCDGDIAKNLIQCDDESIFSALQHIAILAGYTSYKVTKRRTLYIKLRQYDYIIPSKRVEEPYDGLVWCPNVNNGTAIFRRNNNVFISGQTQAPFTNITLDWTVPNDLAELDAIVGGKEQDFKYKDCQKEMDMINKAFIEIMIEGDANGRGFQYPIPSYSITKDFDWSETENNKLLFEMTAKYGTPYFSNYINSDMEPSDVRSMCCRLRLDLRELRKKSGGFFGSGESTGCYDEKTEILTQNRGWIPFKELTLDDYIYTRNNIGEIEIHNPTRLFKYEYKDKLYHFNNSKFDALVTPNHKMVYTDKHTNEQYFVRADEYKHTKHGIPRKAKNLKQDKKIFVLPHIENSWITGNYESEHKKIWTDKYISMETWLKFLGLFISEGSTDNENNAKTHGYRVSISQVKESGKEYIESVLKEMPFKYYHDNKDYVICDKQLWYYCRYSVGADCYCKRIPREILKECSSDELNNLLEALIVGDGSINSNSGQITYYSSSKGLMDDIQELLMLTNHAVTGIRKREPRDSIIGDRKILAKNCNTCYEITISRCEKFYLMPENISQEDYEGYVYCCEVPNHTLMVRRNDKATWCGNSVGVVTINMPRIAYLAKDKEDFFNRLDKLMDIAAKSLDMKRTVITKLLENGLYPYTKRYLGTFNNHFSTIGLVGMNEAGLNAKWLRKDMTHKETQDFSVEVLNHMRERLSDYQEKYGDLFNLEATPAESTSYRLAKHDKEAYPDIITANENGTPYYTNSSHLPVSFSEDIFSALDIQDELQTLYTSGTVFHAFLGEKLPDWKAAANLVRKIAENYKLPYYTMSPTYSVCRNHGYINGEQYTCPICGEQTEVYSRITGYYRPVQNWNDGKSQEFKDRVVYDINKSHLNKQMMIDECMVNENTNDNNIEEKKIYLFATPTCPNCKIACSDLDKNGIEYEKIYANEHPDMCKEFEIRQAPTLVIIENSEIKKFTGVSDIRRFIRS